MKTSPNGYYGRSSFPTGKESKSTQPQGDAVIVFLRGKNQMDQTGAIQGASEVKENIT